MFSRMKPLESSFALHWCWMSENSLTFHTHLRLLCSVSSFNRLTNGHLPNVRFLLVRQILVKTKEKTAFCKIECVNRVRFQPFFLIPLKHMRYFIINRHLLTIVRFRTAAGKGEASILCTFCIFSFFSWFLSLTHA